MFRWLLQISVFLLPGVLGAVAVAADEPIDFAHDVVPILEKHCVECHGGSEAKGGFSLNDRELLLDSQAAIPKNAAESRLVELIRSTDADDQMPPSDRRRLSTEEIGTLTRWIDEGLVWETGFTFAADAYDPPLLPRIVELPEPAGGRTHPGRSHSGCVSIRA